MRRAALARRLAATLGDHGWSEDAVAAVLERRLPSALLAEARKMAAALTAAAPPPVPPPPGEIADVLQAAKGFERVFRWCRRRGVWPDPDLTPPEMTPAPAFAGIDVPVLPTLRDLADWLPVQIERLDYFADLSGRAEASGETAVNHYFYRVAAKRCGGARLIEAPKPGLKGLQRRILRGILDRVPAHDAAFGFIAGRSCLDGLDRHAGEAVVVTFDLADFFGSVGYGRVRGLFRMLGYPEGVATRLAGLTTTRTPPWMLERLPSPARPHLRMPHLPQGAPTSPALANGAAYTLDLRLAGLARRLGAAYSRYADDLAFSGDRHVVRPLLDAVPRIARDVGFRINARKTRVMPAHQRQKVTGVVVNRRLNLPRENYDRLKAIVHACARPGDRRLGDPLFRARLEGRIGWLETVHPERGARLRARLAAAV